ncbi:MAG: Class beta-lactamase-related serine hydrolase [Chloroflexi bacterium]|nr:Class beta-lactamase-related serine hydrolase [Chloroflexota bacterium]
MLRRPRLIALAVAAVMGSGAFAVWAGMPPSSDGPAPTGLAVASPTAAASQSTAPAASPSPPLPTGAPFVPSSIDRSGIVPRLQAALNAGRAELAAPGIVASVLFPDGRQWTGVAGVADLASGRALTPATPFAVASISKTFLAAEILLLVEEGHLALDDSVAALLPSTLVGGAAIDSRITIRMLLDHTSGLRDYLISPALDRAVRAEPTAIWTSEAVLAYAGRPVAPPGEGYNYANTNYVLLGLIAEDLTGRTLAAEFRDRFFEPLGFGSASYQGLEAPVSQLPTSYRYSSGRLDAVPRDVTDGTDIRPFTAITTAAGAAGSVAASARDLARWARALYGGYVLRPDLLAAMLADAEVTQKLDPPYPYGLGVQVFTIDGRVSYGHSGRLVGARSAMRWFP